MPPDRLDPASAAAYALIAITLVMIGALLTAGIISVEQRAVVLGVIFTTLGALAWRSRRPPPPP